MTWRKDVVAERKRIKEPQASCFSGCWLTMTVDCPFVISQRDRTELPEEMDNRDSVRVRVRETGAA